MCLYKRDARPVHLAASPPFVFILGATAGWADEAIPQTVLVPAGPFVIGSDRAERETAYRVYVFHHLAIEQVCGAVVSVLPHSVASHLSDRSKDSRVGA